MQDFLGTANGTVVPVKLDLVKGYVTIGSNEHIAWLCVGAVYSE